MYASRLTIILFPFRFLCNSKKVNTVFSYQAHRAINLMLRKSWYFHLLEINIIFLAKNSQIFLPLFFVLLLQPFFGSSFETKSSSWSQLLKYFGAVPPPSSTSHFLFKKKLYKNANELSRLFPKIHPHPPHTHFQL